jgi:hypothetical protein
MLLRNSRGGAIRVATLEQLGVPSITAYRRCTPGGPWRRPLPGIVLLSNAPPTRRQLIDAALLYAGEDAVVTGAEACRRHGLRTAPESELIHVLIPHERKVRSSDFVLVERTTRHPKPVIVDGVPLAPISRSVLDACRRMTEFDPVRALLADAVQRRGVRPHTLARELELGSNRGTAIARAVLREIQDGARSVAESHAMRVWDRTGLPPLRWNVDLVDERGCFIARPDGWCDEVGLAWEIDSYEYHFTRDGYGRTLERNARYAAAGVIVVQTVPNRLLTEPDRVAAELVAAHRAAAARPRPPVTTRAPM